MLKARVLTMCLTPSVALSSKTVLISRPCLNPHVTWKAVTQLLTFKAKTTEKKVLTFKRMFTGFLQLHVITTEWIFRFMACLILGLHSPTLHCNSILKSLN